MVENTQQNAAVEAAPPEMHTVVLSRPMTLRRDDGSTGVYKAGPNQMPTADKEHWFTQHHLAPDGQAPLDLPTGEIGAGGVTAIIMQRDTAQRDIQVLQTEVRRVTDLWTEAAARLRAREVELTTLKAAHDNAAPKGAPQAADSGRVILEGRLAASQKELGEKDVTIATLTLRAEQAEQAVQSLKAENEGLQAAAAQMRRDIENTAAVENGGAARADPTPPAPPEPLPGTEADAPADPAPTPAKVVKVKGKFYIQFEDGSKSTETYPSHPAAQAALDKLNAGGE